MHYRHLAMIASVLAVFSVAWTGCEESLTDNAPDEGFQVCDDSMTLPDDSYSFDGAEYVGDDTLEIDVGYSGGCETHEWTLCWDGQFMESDPVQVSLDLRHEANGDMCEAYVEETLSFDLQELRDDYESGYQTDTGTIIMRLTGHDESVTYDW